jgi:uroporphyrinogen decarboxylase
VLETVRAVVGELSPEVPLIGFAGAPFTVASYLVEGRPSRTYAKTKAMMLGDPVLFGELLDRLAHLAADSIESQVRAGARAFQLFDSWAGALTPAQYERHVLPHSRTVFSRLAALDVPGIHFGVTTGELLGLMADAGADVVGVDWRTPLDVARRRIDAASGGRSVGVQGNLDPAVCLCPWDVVETKVREVLAANGDRPGHVFNLGHGVLPETDPAILERVVTTVHELTRR